MRYPAAFTLILALAACASAPTRLPAADGPRIDLLVHGIDCSGCAREIHQWLTQLPGVTAATVDRRAGRVTVVVSETDPPSRAQLIDTIEHTGRYRVLDATE